MQRDSLMARAQWVLVVVLAAGGAWISGALLVHQANIWGGVGDGVFGRVCQATAVLGMDCAHAGDSRWATVPVPAILPAEGGWDARWLHVPLAFLGLAYFVTLATWYAVTGLPRAGRWDAAVQAGGVMGAIVSGFYLMVMATQLAPLCVWCVAAHGINLTLVAIQRRLHRRSSAPSGKSEVQIPGRRPALTALAFAGLVIAGLWLFHRDHIALGQQIQALRPYRQVVTALRGDAEFLRREYYAQPVAPIPRTPDAVADRPELVVFTDYTCAACYCNAQRIKGQVLPAFDGRLDVVIRHFPMGQACNSASNRPGAAACLAAHAAQAARVQGGDAAFQRMHELLFQHRHEITLDRCIALAGEIGLDPARFRRDLAGPVVQAAIESDVALARDLGVTGVPVMFLNHRRVPALGVDNPIFWRAMAEDLARPNPRGGVNP